MDLILKETQNDEIEIQNLVLNHIQNKTADGGKNLIVDIKSPKFKSGGSKSRVKQAYAIEFQNDFHLECEINSQMQSDDENNEPLIYWWFKSSITNRSTILKRPNIDKNPTLYENENQTSPNKITIVSRIFIDCASREHEGEYFCAAVKGRAYDWSKVELKVLG